MRPRSHPRRVLYGYVIEDMNLDRSDSFNVVVEETPDKEEQSEAKDKSIDDSAVGKSIGESSLQVTPRKNKVKFVNQK